MRAHMTLATTMTRKIDPALAGGARVVNRAGRSAGAPRNAPMRELPAKEKR